MTERSLPVPAFHPGAARRRDAADVLLDGATACKQAVAMLRRNGFVPERIVISVSGRPSVQVRPSALTAQAIQDERACYFQYTSRERHGQFLERPCGVIVTWVERH